MKKISIAALILWALVAVVPAGRSAAQVAQCALRPVMIEFLELRYQEVPVAVGVISDDFVLEILAQSDGITWTILLTGKDGGSCIVSAGHDWQLISMSGGNKI